MSDSSVPPVAAPPTPFVPTTTPGIDRANRLISLQSHPGFLDLIRLSEELIGTAQAVSTDYGGWDLQQNFVLKVRAQAAKEYHNLLLFGKIREVIEAGVAEMAAQMAEQDRRNIPEKSIDEMLEQGDYVRQSVLTEFEKLDSRVAGSF